MRVTFVWTLMLGAAIVALMLVVLAPRSASGGTSGDVGPIATDLNMVVAIDRSESVDRAERRAQIDSLAGTLLDPRFLQAVRGSWHGRIGFAVMTWSSFNRTHVVVPWMIIDGRRSAEQAVDRIRAYQLGGRDGDHKTQTDIALALEVGANLLRAAPFRGIKSVLNVVSDGIDNFGREAFIDRDLALAEGYTINGLIHARGSAMEIVERYFRRQVIGGPSAFVQRVSTPEGFKDATLRKMLLEIALLTGRLSAL